MIKEKLTKQLVEKFGIDGNGKLGLGRKGTKITVEEFEAWSGVKLTRGQENEYGGEDSYITLIDEDGEDFNLTLEVQDSIITHSYY